MQEIRKEFLDRFQSLVSIDPLDTRKITSYIEWLERELKEARNDLGGKDIDGMTKSDLVTKAMSVYGLNEIQGNLDEPLIVEMFKVSGHKWVDNDEVAWCSAFMNWVAIKCGFESTGELDAKSWLDVGEKIKTDDAKMGDVIILWRVSPNDWRGHVGIYLGQDSKYYHILGGNQNNQVNVSKYPKKRLKGFRRLKRL